MINKRVEFLKELMGNLKGITFIEHKAYLKELKTKLENYRKDVQVSEYLEEYDLT